MGWALDREPAARIRSFKGSFLDKLANSSEGLDGGASKRNGMSSVTGLGWKGRSAVWHGGDGLGDGLGMDWGRTPVGTEARSGALPGLALVWWTGGWMGGASWAQQ